jgi:hypothetical protein
VNAEEKSGVNGDVVLRIRGTKLDKKDLFGMAAG